MMLDLLEEWTEIDFQMPILTPNSFGTGVIILLNFPAISAPNSTIRMESESSLNLLDEADVLGSYPILTGRGQGRGYKGFFVSSK